MFSVQHSTPEAFDDWRETSASSKDFQDWVQTALSKIHDRLVDASPGSDIAGILIFYPVRRSATRNLQE